MQKLFENWRRYRKEILNEISDERLGYEAEGRTIRSMEFSPEESGQLLTTARQIAAIGDPTGVLSWPELVDPDTGAIARFAADPSLFNAGRLALATLAVIPVASLLAAPGKLIKVGSALPKISITVGARGTVYATTDIAKIVSRDLAKTPGGKQMSLEIDAAISTVKAATKITLSSEEVARQRSPERVEDYKKAISQRNSPLFLKIIHDLFQWKGIHMDDKNLAAATQGSVPGEGPPSQIFDTAKPIKTIGVGGFGVAVLLDNGHVIKFFAGTTTKVGGIANELKHYEKLLTSQHARGAKFGDLAVFEYGTIPLPASSDPGAAPAASKIGRAHV